MIGIIMWIKLVFGLWLGEEYECLWLVGGEIVGEFVIKLVDG